MPSKGSGALAGAGQGAAAGTMIMPGWGTAIGAVVGGIAGYLGADEAHYQPWVNVPKGINLKTANQLDKFAWNNAFNKYDGGAIASGQTLSGARAGYAAGDAMGAGDSRFVGAGNMGFNDRMLSSANDTSVNANAVVNGRNMHQWALNGKVTSGTARLGYQNQIAQWMRENQLYNAGIKAQDDAATQANYAAAAKGFMGAAGGMIGGMGTAGSTSTSTMAGFNSAGGVTPAGGGIVNGNMAGFNSSGNVVGGTYNPYGNLWGH